MIREFYSAETAEAAGFHFFRKCSNVVAMSGHKGAPQKNTMQKNMLRNGDWKCSNSPRSLRARTQVRI